MKNSNLYVNIPVREKEIELRTSKLVEPLPKVRRRDINPMYRKNTTAQILNGILWTVTGLLVLNCILFFATVL